MGFTFLVIQWCRLVRDQPLNQLAQSAQNKTMGTLVGMLTESFLTPPPPNEEDSQTEADVGDQIWLRHRFQLEMTAEHYEAMKADLKELVDLRNKLVHHFIERFDLWSESGCQAADGFLEESYETINRHCLNLQCWAKTMIEERAKTASFIQSQSDCTWPDSACRHRSLRRGATRGVTGSFSY